MRSEPWTTWKYPIPLSLEDGLHGDVFEIEMPEGAHVLSAGAQKGCPVLWAAVAEERKKEARQFLLGGTGHPLMKHPKLISFIGTVLLMNDNFVLHVFEIRP